MLLYTEDCLCMCVHIDKCKGFKNLREDMQVCVPFCACVKCLIFFIYGFHLNFHFKYRTADFFSYRLLQIITKIFSLYFIIWTS